MIPCQALNDVWVLSLLAQRLRVKRGMTFKQKPPGLLGDAQEFLGLGTKIAPLGAALRH